MRIVTALLVAGPFLLFGLLPASGQTTASYSSAPTTDRGGYLQRAQNEIQIWQEKLREFDAKAEATGRKDLVASEQTLKLALNKAKIESDKLQAAGAEDWENTKGSYEKASHELSLAWQKASQDI